MRKLRIGLLGHGVVGGGVRKIIDEGASPAVKMLSVEAVLVHKPEDCLDGRFTADPEAVLNRGDLDVIVECMGGLEPAHAYVKRALENGKHAVTSNKKMLAHSAAELLDTARRNGVRLLYEASCGGGIPWMEAVERIRRIDEISSFEGIFNGTSNFILSGMKDGHRDFDEMLAEARRLGYAEQDPSDDIDGTDTACKVSLSCLQAFDALVSPEEIAVSGIRRIRPEDLAAAEAMQRTCRLIGRAERKDGAVNAMVLPVFVKNSDLSASVSGSFNMISCRSETLGEAAFYGPGAGRFPTAHAVVQDLLDLAEEKTAPVHQASPVRVDHQLYVSRFYVRTAKPVVFAAIAAERCGESSFVTGNVSLTEIMEYAAAAEDESMFLAEVN